MHFEIDVGIERIWHQSTQFQAPNRESAPWKVRSHPAAQSNRTSHFGSEFSGVRELAPDRLHNQTTSNRTSARQNTNRLAIDKCFHTLKVWSEFSLGDTGGLDTDSTKIFRLTSPSNSVSRSGTGSSKKANAWHSYLRRVAEDSHIRWELQVFEMTGQFPPQNRIGRAVKRSIQLL